jgi:DpnII restriction endonuclease
MTYATRRLKQANAFERTLWSGDPWDTLDNAAWQIEIAYLKLLAAVEVLDLKSVKVLILADIAKASSKENGFADSEMGVEEPYSIWMARFRQYIAALETLGGPSQAHSVTKDLVEILRAAEYPITDPKLFGAVPTSENDVHRRIEGVLRCVFPDLKHKPALSKPIKNFEPDTGLPGIRTLIEYKFLARMADAPVIADQILADTRGYSSPDWDTFVYVIYETRRFRPEREWNDLLRSCAASQNTIAIVLSGEPSEPTNVRPRRHRANRTA